MLFLGLETTCDETSAAVVHRAPDGVGRILSNVVYSQEEHQIYGGVVPELAARAHVEALDRIIAHAVDQARVDFSSLDGIAAAAGPGLIGGVIVGLTAGKALSLVLDVPFIAVNHLEAHALTARLTHQVGFPYLLLLVSGGHTQIVSVEGVGQYRMLGSTLDDAIGEAFDKVAKILGLGFPGGPEVERVALAGNAERFRFPRPLKGHPVPDFSLSGLKTAVRQEAGRLAPLSDQDVADLCAGFQAAVADVILDRMSCAMRLRAGYSTLVIAGGVAANGLIRKRLHTFAEAAHLTLVAPPPALCTDNAAMIAWAGLERFMCGRRDRLDFAPRARWPLIEMTL